MADNKLIDLSGLETVYADILTDLKNNYVKTSEVQTSKRVPFNANGQTIEPDYGDGFQLLRQVVVEPPTSGTGESQELNPDKPSTTISAGYYANDINVGVKVASPAPTITSLDESGKGGITATESTGFFDQVSVNVGKASLNKSTVTPSTTIQKVSISEGYTKAGEVLTVEAILTETPTITAGTSNKTLTATSGKYITSATVEPTPTKDKTVTSSNEPQKVYPDTGFHLGQVTVNAMPDATVSLGGTSTPGTATLSNGTIKETTASDYYVELSTKAGSVTPTANVSKAGYVGSISNGSAVSVGVTSNKAKLYIAAASANTDGVTNTNPGKGPFVTIDNVTLLTGSATKSKYIPISAGYVGDSCIQIDPLDAGLAKIPANQNVPVSVSGTPTVDSNGKISLNITGSKAITPTVTPGYVTSESGQSGTVTANGTVTYTDANFKAENIKSGTLILGVTGTYTNVSAAEVPLASELVSGKKVYANGDVIVGTATSITITDQEGLEPAHNSFTPTTTDQTINISAGFNSSAKTVTIAAIPEQYKDTTGITTPRSRVLSGYSVVTSAGTVQGTMPNNSGNTFANLTPDNSSLTLDEGYYDGNTITVKADDYLVTDDNITSGAAIVASEHYFNSIGFNVTNSTTTVGGNTIASGSSLSLGSTLTVNKGWVSENRTYTVPSISSDARLVYSVTGSFTPSQFTGSNKTYSISNANITTNSEVIIMPASASDASNWGKNGIAVASMSAGAATLSAIYNTATTTINYKMIIINPYN